MTPALNRIPRARQMRFAVAFLLICNLIFNLSPTQAAYAFAQEPQQQQMPAQPTVSATPPPSLSPQSTPTPQREPTIQGDTERQQREQAQPSTQQQQPGATTAQQQRAAQQATDPVSRLRYRQIGPYRGGRVAAVAGIASQPYVYYFGATGGGVFKTTDGGVNWEPVSDGFFKTGSVGAIGIGDSDPNTLYVGMGEATVRGNVSHGDGMYKSLDAGKTWKHIGLDDTRHIVRVRVHPKNSDIVYVAALGHLYGANEQRGVFRTRDGGKTWQKILYRDDKTGAMDLTFDPSNPNILYAGFWQVKRTPHSFESGGAGGGLFKSSDGGDTWQELTRNAGMPRGVIGKVGVTVSPVNPERVWAIIEAEDGGVFRSDNAGATWTRTNDNRNLRQRAWYYNRIYADTQNVDMVYVLNVAVHKSSDGGRTFTTVGTPHSDNHDLWIAPNDNSRMIEGNDGGANVTFNAGRTWTEQDQATAQFYRVTLDQDFPYNIYGAQQDNSTVKIASRTEDFGIDRTAWYDVGGGESGWVTPQPKNSNIIFAGSYGGLLTRYDHRSKQLRNVTVYPDNPMGAGAEAMRYRFQWNFPVLFSPHADASGNYALYAGGNVLFKSLDEGQSWQAISPDLTRNDRSKQGSSGGAITKDNTSVEYYCTIFAVAESNIERGVIWTGSDDGLVHVTRDAGKSWDNVTPKGMPEWIQINSVEASPNQPGAAYVAATAYKSDDFRPYLYKTSDYGKSWQKITNGIAADAFTRVIREDPARRGLLYAGTETGMYVSFDDGAQWRSLQLNMPIVPITDLAIHKRDNDLVVATQGRSFYVLDDLNILHGMNDQIRTQDAFLFQPEDAYRTPGFGGAQLPATATVGANPSNGVTVFYFLREQPKGEVALEFLDAQGKPIKKFTGKAPDANARSGAPNQSATGAPAGESGGGRGGSSDPPLGVAPGLNRFVWDMRYADASRFPNLILWAASTRGPRAVPGAYQVRLTASGKTLTENFSIRTDPRVQTTEADFARQLELLLKIRDKVTETHDAIRTIRDARSQIESVVERTKGNDSIASAAKSLLARMTTIEEELYQTKLQSGQDPLNYPIRLNNKLAALGGVVDSSDSVPTEQSYTVYADLVAKIDAQLAVYRQIVQTDIPAFNRLAREQSVPAISVTPS